MPKQKKRFCKVCGNPFIHNSKVRCKNCRIKRVKISPSWDDGLNVINAGENKRDRLVMRLQLFQAFREGELLGSDDPRHGNLKPMIRRQIDFENKKIVVYGKGGTVEYVFLDDKTIVMLKDYLKNKKLEPHEPIFNLGTRQFQRIVKRAAKKAGVETWQRFSPHTFRSISITQMITKKGLTRAKLHARHTSERTTAGYDRPPMEVRRKDFDDVFNE